MLRILVTLSALSAALAFLAPASTMHRLPRTMHRMRASDVQKLAEACIENGCPIEDVHVLRSELKAERARLQENLGNLEKVIGKLSSMENKLDEHIEAAVAAAVEEEDKDINRIVDDIAAAFGKFKDDYPSLGSPTGFSGKPHKGTKDAWDFDLA